MSTPLLLSVMEVGGYPDFTSLYERLGYRVVRETSMRKVLKFLKQQHPEVIVAEFNFQSDFRDRTSSLESLLALVQRRPDVAVIVLYDREYAHQLARLEEHFSFAAKLAFPVGETDMERALLAARAKNQ
ncbi:MAG: hypothetical protein R3E95_20605 [Thiolinea sp.]